MKRTNLLTARHVRIGVFIALAHSHYYSPDGDTAAVMIGSLDADK